MNLYSIILLFFIQMNWNMKWIIHHFKIRMDLFLVLNRFKKCKARIWKRQNEFQSTSIHFCFEETIPVNKFCIENCRTVLVYRPCGFLVRRTLRFNFWKKKLVYRFSVLFIKVGRRRIARKSSFMRAERRANDKPDTRYFLTFASKIIRSIKGQ